VGDRTRHVEVSFPDGKVALTAFWGYLARGGLVLFGQRDLREGEPVALDVHIAQAHAELLGVVVRAEPSGPTVVEFEADGTGRFLRAALGGRPIDRECAVADLDAGGTRRARLIGLAEPGCTLALGGDDGALAVGTRVELVLSGGPARGDVVWARGRERGVLFDDDADAAVSQTLRSR
jgi:hypothetical protein